MDYQPVDQLQPTKSTNGHINLFESPHKKESLIGSHGEILTVNTWMDILDLWCHSYLIDGTLIATDLLGFHHPAKKERKKCGFR